MIYPDEEQTHADVERHYNDLDKRYRRYWGEHIHHGLWHKGSESVEKATEQLIDAVIAAGGIDANTKVCDVGCGYGATSRYLAKKHEAVVTSMTISKEQWQHARVCDPESLNPHYLLGNFLHNEFPDAHFDVVISIESSEHMVDKEQFFKEVARILRPGGRFVTCAWLAKNQPKPWEIKHFLEPICREGRLPSMGSELDYRNMAEDAGLTVSSFDDLSSKVKKTWSICGYRILKGMLTDKELRTFLGDKSAPERIFAKTLFRIWGAYQTKSMRYGLLTAQKPLSS